MSRLTLRLHGDSAAEDAAVEWLVRTDDGAVAGHGRVAGEELAGVIAEHAPWADDPARVVVLVDAADVLAISCRVPGRSAAQIRRAAPYAVEEFVTEDIDTMHVACGAVDGQNVECLVAPRSGIAAWLQLLASAGVAPGYLTSDAMALPVAEQAVTVVYDGNAALVRAPGQAASVDVANLPGVLEALGADFAEEPVPVLRQVGGALTDLELSQAGFAPRQLETVDYAGPVLAYLAESFAAAGAANMLQGEFAARRRAKGAWAPWRAVAASASAAAVLALGVLAAQGIWANQKADALQQEAVDLFRAIYDVDRVPGNPATRMRFRLGQAVGTESGFHRLAGQLGMALGELQDRFDLVSLTYSERRGLGAEVLVSDYDTLESLQATLAARGVELEVAAAEQFEQRVRANLRLSG